MGRIVAWAGRPELEPGEDLPAQLRARGHRSEDDLDGRHDPPSLRPCLGHVRVRGRVVRALRGASGRPQPPARGRSSTAIGRRSTTTPSTTARSTSTAPPWTRTRPSGAPSTCSATAACASRTPRGTPPDTRSVICRLRDRDLVIAGDAIYTLAQLDDAPPPPRPEDPHTWRRSLQELRLFHRQYPQAVIIPGHDPRTLAGAEAALRIALLAPALGLGSTVYIVLDAVEDRSAPPRAAARGTASPRAGT